MIFKGPNLVRGKIAINNDQKKKKKKKLVKGEERSNSYMAHVCRLQWRVKNLRKNREKAGVVQNNIFKILKF